MNRSMTDTSHARNVRTRGLVAQMARTDRAQLAEALERENMAEIERAAIAKRIRQARKEAGMSQPEMAEAIGVIHRTYQNYESLKEPRTPWGSMNDIAKITGRSTEWLIHGDKATPELLAGLSSGDQVSAGFEEFRGYVSDILARLEAADVERRDMQRLIDQQNANLLTQTQVLENIVGSLADLPAVANALGVLLQQLEAVARPQRREGGEG